MLLLLLLLYLYLCYGHVDVVVVVVFGQYWFRVFIDFRSLLIFCQFFLCIYWFWVGICIGNFWSIHCFWKDVNNNKNQYSSICQYVWVFSAIYHMHRSKLCASGKIVEDWGWGLRIEDDDWGNKYQYNQAKLTPNQT